MCVPVNCSDNEHLRRCCVQMLSYDRDRRDLNIYPKLSLILCIHRLTPPGSEVWPALDVLSELKPKFLG